MISSSLLQKIRKSVELSLNCVAGWRRFRYIRQRTYSTAKIRVVLVETSTVLITSPLGDNHRVTRHQGNLYRAQQINRFAGSRYAVISAISAPA